MNRPDNNELLAQVIESARRSGASDVRVRLNKGVSNQVEMRNGKIELLQQSRDQKLSITLFVEGRYGVVSTNRLNHNEIKSLTEEGIAAIRLLTIDEHRQLPATHLLYKEGLQDLGCYDPTIRTLTADQRLAIPTELHQSIDGADARLISAQTTYSDSEYSTLLMDSQGTIGYEEKSFFSCSAVCSVHGEGEARPEGYHFTVSNHLDRFEPNTIATVALEKTLSRIGSRKAPSGTYPCVVDSLVMNTLFSPIISAAYGSSVYQKESFLTDKLNVRCFSDKLKITDIPRMYGKIGSSLFDREGIATQERCFIDNGSLQFLFIDSYYGAKLGMSPTVEGPSVFHFEGGGLNSEELLRTMDRGIFITGFNGGNANASTGDFSYGIEGFWVERGVLSYPIGEMNITGNLIDLWSQIIEVGGDVNETSSWRMPSILFEKVHFSGC